MEFCANRGAIRGGSDADHTGNGVVARWEHTAGANYSDAADRALIKLTKLTQSAKRIELIELWSLTSVAKRIQSDASGNASWDELEAAFLVALIQAVTNVCREKYLEEWGRGRGACT